MSSLSSSSTTDHVLFPGISEFGRVLAEMISDAPGARGAVLSDCKGEPIDVAYFRSRSNLLDTQLVGAQLSVTIFKLAQTAARWDCDFGVLILEAEQGSLITTILSKHYQLSLSLGIDANIARSTIAFERAGIELVELLR